MVSKNTTKWKENTRRVPPQPNNTDCGLYIMKSFEKFLDFVNRNLKWPEFSYQEVLSFRREIKQTILDEISNKNKSYMMQIMRWTKTPATLRFVQD